MQTISENSTIRQAYVTPGAVIAVLVGLGLSGIGLDSFQASAAPAPAPLNLLPNSGFEVTTTEAMPDYWGPVENSWGTAVDQWVLDTDSWRARWGVDRTVNHTPGGKNSLRIVSSVPTPPELKAVANWISLTANLTRTLSVWLRSDQPNLPVTLEVSGCTPSAIRSITTPPTPNSWQRYSLVVSPTASSSNVQCLIYPRGNGTLWVDDAQLENGTVATPWTPSVTDATIAVAVHKVVKPIGDQAITPGGSKVTIRIDSSGHFLVDGQPFIPMAMGWARLPSPAVVRHLAQAGFNMIVTYLPATCAIPDIRAFLDSASANGLKVAIIPERDVSMAMLKNWIFSLKEQPALIMWYVYDEPVTSAEWQAANDRYALVKATDPTRPAMVNAVPATTYKDWKSDVLSADYYPIPVDVCGSISLFGDMIENMHQVATTAGKPTWFWLQNMGYAYFCPREPTGAEAECMAYLSFIRGSRGIVYFFQKSRTVEQWDELRQLNREVATLTPVLSSTDTPPAVTVKAPSIHVLSKRYAGQNYVFAVNESPTPVTAAALTSSATSSGSATVLFENREVRMVNGTITDSFAGYQRHVYRIGANTQ